MEEGHFLEIICTANGACYTAYQRGQEELMKEQEGPVYLDESKLKEQISIQLRQHGK